MQEKFKELYDKTIQCPLCQFEFTTKKVRLSRLRLIKRDADFLSHYNAENPIKYNIFVCPSCGFAALESKFEKVSPRDAEKIIKNISSKWRSRDFGGVRTLDQSIESYKLALLISNLIRNTKLELASLCLNIGWLYRLKEDKNEELRFLSMARKRYIEAYNTESLAGSNMDDSKLSYLIGELSRRLNKKEEALTWFNTCLRLAATKSNPTLEQIVREQWRMAREG